MKNTHTVLVKNSLWVIGGFGFGQALRLVSSVILARLLAPEIFGIMVIVYSIRGGIDLLSDIGVQQSIVANKNADEPEFYNTAWTLRLLRGILVFAFCVLFAAPLSKFYDTPILIWIMPVIGLSFPIVGLGSLGTMFLQKQLRSAKLSAFELGLEIITSISQIIFAWFSPTIWCLVFGGLVHSIARAIGNYVIVPDLRHRFLISPRFAKQIFTFGSWIFLSSLIYFLSANFDRLYLGKAIPLEILGVYGIARSLAEIANTLVSRLNYITIFPFIASQSEISRSALRAQIASSRAIFLMIAAGGLAVLVVSSDWIIAILYDHRYHNAGWMLAALTLGVWFSIICTINESTLLGFGKPQYGVFANGLKLVWLVVGIPTCVVTYGVAGVIIVVLLSDAWRYPAIFIGQHRERFSFVWQDAMITGVFFALIASGEWLRWSMGFQTSFGAIWPTILN
jgi:O-antigen/teichoic acid export membrane protein